MAGTLLNACGRALSVLGLALAVASGPALPARAAQNAEPRGTVRILAQWSPQAQFAGFMMAREKGFFQEAGLPPVILLWSKLGDKPLYRLVAGEVDFVSAWAATGVLRRIEGLDVVNVGQYMQKSATMTVARAGRGITKPEDLNGKVILSWGGDFDSEFRLFLDTFNIKPKAVFPLSGSLAPMLQGAADASQAMYYNEYHSLLERGLRKEDLVEFHYAGLGLNFVGDGLFTTGAYREANPEICAAVHAAILKGWAYAFAHEEETLRVVLRYAESQSVVTNMNHQRWMLRTIKDLMTHQVGPDPKDWGALRRADYDFIIAALKKQGYDVSALSYETFYRPAAAAGKP